ncbi:MAG: hypothetical protein V4582_06365 [Pseudomonadota bacterium]
MKHARALGRRLLGAVLLAAAAGALAVPAPWYQWRSKQDGKLACAQTSPGPGWEKAHGPFKDSHCTKPGHTK